MKENMGLLVLRFVAAVPMLALHGWPKLINFKDKMNTFPDPFGFIGSQVSLSLAVFSEFFCCFLILAGFKTRLASIPPLITMIVAVVIVHGSHGWDKKELGTLYFFIYLAVILLGPGKFSVDHIIGKKDNVT